MAKNPSPRSPESMPSFCSSYSSLVLNKLKCLVPVEPSLAILGFFLVALVFILSCVFYLDYGIVSREYKLGERSQRFMWLGSEEGEGGLVSEEKVGFLENGGEGCDLFSGDWVWDEKNYPLYKERDCLFLDEGFRCSENGRPDDFYTKWRWQPKDCNLPRFDAKIMLEKLRNRRVVFVGDSIGRNQWESLLCMLSTDIKKDSVYEVNGSPITKHTGFLVFKFRDYNCTIEYYRAPFLVLQSRPPPGVAEKVKTTLKLDIMDWTSVRWKDADVLVFNTGHWWNYEKTIRGGCYFQEGKKVRMEMSVESAYRKSIETLIDWIGKEVNMNKSQVFLRTYAPVHFRGGDWKTGGNCHMETLPDVDSSLISYPKWTELKIVNQVLSAHSNEAHVMKMTVLNVTQMTSRRKDGHSSLYYLGPKTGPAPLYRQDCSHWCLPGVPDAWNELLYALFVRREVLARTSNSTDT